MALGAGLPVVRLEGGGEVGELLAVGTAEPSSAGASKVKARVSASSRAELHASNQPGITVSTAANIGENRKIWSFRNIDIGTPEELPEASHFFVDGAMDGPGFTIGQGQFRRNGLKEDP